MDSGIFPRGGNHFSGRRGHKRRHVDEEDAIDHSDDITNHDVAVLRGTTLPQSMGNPIQSKVTESYGADSVPIHGHAPTAGPEMKVTIFVGTERQEVAQSRFLFHVRGDGLNSVCHECGQDFSSGGDILLRTVAFENTQTNRPTSQDITQGPITLCPIRIINRHFQCARTKKVGYIPISHAWHGEVSDVQNERPNDFNITQPLYWEATRLVYQTVATTLLAIKNEFGPTEIWHDYLSVPQWRADIQGALIRSISAIFGYPFRTGIHWDDVDTAQLVYVFDNNTRNLFLAGLNATTRSRWFERMWVTLEYLQSNEVFIIGQDLVVYNITASELVQTIDDHISAYETTRSAESVWDEAERRGCIIDMHVSWRDMEGWKEKDNTHRTLGGATYIMGLKKCRDFSDYFLALDTMMGYGIRNDPGVLLSRFQQFLALGLQALERGDYTPLLFTSVEEEPPDSRAPWLRGYSKMSPLFWDLGVCLEKATVQQIIYDGIIQPELEPVGVIEECEYLEVPGHLDDDMVFCMVIPKILVASGNGPQSFCNAVNRIYPNQDTKGRYLKSATEIVNQVRRKKESNGIYNFDVIEQLLERFINLDDRPDATEHDKLVIARQLISVMRLNDRGKRSGLSPLSATYGEVDWYVRKHGKPMEFLVRIRCKNCACRSLFRLTCWEKPTLGATMVYRIPGLLFDETVKEGVGLVICETRIIGKMAYGTPACACRKRTRVQLGRVIP